MKITINWLEENDACEKGIEWFKNQSLTDPVEIIKHFLDTGEHLDWATWLIVRVMEYKEYVSYAVFAAEQVLSIFEEKYPNDTRPRDAIEAAKKCIENPSKENEKAAFAAAEAAYTYAASAFSAAYAAAYAAAAAAASAYAAAEAAYTYAYAAAASTYAAAYKKELQIKILKYGLQLLCPGDDLSRQVLT